jgi:hypothetical protein
MRAIIWDVWDSAICYMLEHIQKSILYPYRWSSSRRRPVNLRELPLRRVEGTVRRGVEEELGRGGGGMDGIDESFEERGEVFGPSDAETAD